jgi:hypothetical protein
LVIQLGLALDSNVIFLNKRHFSQKRSKPDSPVSRAGDQIVGFVIESAGDAAICTSTGEVWPANDGTPIREGSILLSAAENGFLSVFFFDESTLTLFGESQVLISDFTVDYSSKSGTQLLDLIFGKISYQPGTIATVDPNSARVRFLKTTLILRAAAAQITASAAKDDRMLVKLVPDKDGFTGELIVVSPYGIVNLDRSIEYAIVSGRLRRIVKRRMVNLPRKLTTFTQNILSRLGLGG